jgi:hypothetical protein
LETNWMKTLILAAALAAGFTVTGMAQTTVTAACKDGTNFSGTSRSGACSGHGGVQTWGTSAATPPAAVHPAAKAPPASTTSQAPAPGGAPDKVWVNTASKVYHCPGTQWYGTTKKGEYMTEAAAKAAGNHADHGKACSS